MLEKITDAIRHCLGAIVGMVGYSIISDYELAEKEAKIKQLTFEKTVAEGNLLIEKKKKGVEFLQDYSYAILVGKENVTPQVWNEGRYEPRVRTITFIATPGSVPELTLKK